VLAAVSSGQLWAMSLGGGGRAELSLTDAPAFRASRILGWGQAARAAWDLLVPGVAPDPAEVTSTHFRSRSRRGPPERVPAGSADQQCRRGRSSRGEPGAAASTLE
jgi:hypothetical protein